jgi:glycosyltransferase involved in cell wall biosynthesis
MKLSILIPTLPERENFLHELQNNITRQCQGVEGVEVVTDNRGRHFTTGEKRNYLLQACTGEYVWFVDDDDEILPGAIPAILQAIETGPDVLGINGFMTTDGRNRIDWEIRLGHAYREVQRNGRPFYERFPNHITPMRRHHAIRVAFPHKTIFEDYEWACALKQLDILKTQVVIEQPVYHYRVRTKK